MAVSDQLRDRLSALTPREKRFLFVGAIVLALFVLYLLLQGDGEGSSDGVELTAAPPPPTALPVSSARPLMGPQPMPPPSGSSAPPIPISPLPAAASGDPASVSGLVLKGVFGGGPGGGAALIATEPGSQHLVRVGRQVIPGVTLKEVGMNYALLETASGDLRMGFSASPAPSPDQ